MRCEGTHPGTAAAYLLRFQLDNPDTNYLQRGGDLLTANGIGNWGCSQHLNPIVAKVGGLQSQGVDGEAVAIYREPLTTLDLESSGFPVAAVLIVNTNL